MWEEATFSRVDLFVRGLMMAWGMAIAVMMFYKG